MGIKKRAVSRKAISAYTGSKKSKQPSFERPMLATLTKKYFSSSEWIFEEKYDGERCLAIKKNGIVHLMSRNRRNKNRQYPEIVSALEKQTADNFIIDGELIALNKKKISDFQALQARMNIQDNKAIATLQKTTPVYYCIFDILYTDGYNVKHVPLLQRKTILKKLLRFNRILKYTKHRSPDGIAYLKEACKAHWEGIIAKKKDSPYLNKRSSDWLKFKCVKGQELVIGGYTKPKGSRTDFGALLVGYYDGTKLKYAGKVGTGFDQKTLKMLGKRLRALATEKCPFTDYDASENNIHWVRPTLVGEFKFAEWTRTGRLRVGRYEGLRDDKKAKDVIRER